MTVEELAQAAKEVIDETNGAPRRVALMLRYWFDHPLPPFEELTVWVRNLIEDILAALEVQWDRSEDAPTWPEDGEDD